MTKVVTRSDGVTVGAGRRLLLTPELRDAICNTLSICRYVNIACEANGVNPQTAYKWIRLGEQHEKSNHPDLGDCTANCEENDVAFRAFTSSIKKTKAIATTKSLENISKHGVTQWQAEAWILERTNQSQFGMKQTVEHTGENGGPIKHSVAVSIEQKQAMLEAAKQSLLMEQNEDGVYEVKE